MNELIAFVAPMLVLAGLTCGWTTETLLPARGFGLRADMGLALGGSFVLAVALYALGWFGGTGLVVTFALGLVGGALAIVAQRTMWADDAVPLARA